MSHLMKAAICVITLQLFLGLAGCAKSDSGSSSTPTNQCQAGSGFHPTYGCLQQANCGAGYGMYNNQCIPLSNTANNGSPYNNNGYPYNNGNMTSIQCPAGMFNYGGQCVAANSQQYGTCQGSCQAGYVMTSYGCYPQGACSPCYGSYDRYCIGGAPVNYAWYPRQQ